MEKEIKNSNIITNNSLLQGKKILVTGIANNMSIATKIAQNFINAGADVAITYQAENLKERASKVASEINCTDIFECNATNEDSVNNLFAQIKQKWGRIDVIVHAIAFADKNELKGKYLNTSLDNFLNTMHISCFSLNHLAKAALPLMKDNGGSIITLSYLGATQVMPSYNVMGVAKAALEASVKYLAYDLGEYNIRVNAISAGPVKTLAARGIGDFQSMLKMHANTAPLKRNIDAIEVANSALYLASHLSSGVTGEIHFVDSGYNIMGASAN